MIYHLARNDAQNAIDKSRPLQLCYVSILLYQNLNGVSRDPDS